VAPLNPYLQDPESQARYERMVAAMVAELSARRGVTVLCPPALPSAEYADASHPLAFGYARLARGMLADPGFQAWLGAARRGGRTERTERTERTDGADGAERGGCAVATGG
jgi:hypothetical protein